MKPIESVVTWPPGTLPFSSLLGSPRMRPSSCLLQLLLTAGVIAVLAQSKLLCGLLDLDSRELGQSLAVDLIRQWGGCDTNHRLLGSQPEQGQGAALVAEGVL